MGSEGGGIERRGGWGRSPSSLACQVHMWDAERQRLLSGFKRGVDRQVVFRGGGGRRLLMGRVGSKGCKSLN